MATVSKIKTMKSLARLVNTWLRNDTERGEEITMIMREFGLITPTGKFKRSKAIYKAGKDGKSPFEMARNRIEKEYGYYSKYEKKMKEQYKRAIEQGLTTAKGWKKYEKQKKDFSALVQALFENFPSENAFEEYQYCLTLDIGKAIERLSEEIEKGHILTSEEYREQYGDFTAPEFN